LGVVLFLLPPFLKVDVERLERFAALIPPGIRAAFEFRNPTWNDEAVHRTLERHGFSWCISDQKEPDPAVVRTAPYGYVRMRHTHYTDADLARWFDRLRAPGWEDMFVFFEEEEEAHGPRLAQAFLRLARP
jgi:uncharacterized protein YecE (DUF72 family)